LQIAVIFFRPRERELLLHYAAGVSVLCHNVCF